jgi:hypothetical protein
MTSMISPLQVVNYGAWDYAYLSVDWDYAYTQKGRSGSANDPQPVPATTRSRLRSQVPQANTSKRSRTSSVKKPKPPDQENHVQK